MAEVSCSTFDDADATQEAPVKVGFFTITISKVVDAEAVGRTEYPSGMTTAPVLPEARRIDVSGTNVVEIAAFAVVIRTTLVPTFFSYPPSEMTVEQICLSVAEVEAPVFVIS